MFSIYITKKEKKDAPQIGQIISYKDMNILILNVEGPCVYRLNGNEQYLCSVKKVA